MNAVVTGEVDVIDRVDLRTVRAAAARADDRGALDRRDRALRLPDGHPGGALHRQQRAPGAEVRHRPRRSWSTRSCYGYGSVGNDHPIGTSNRFYRRRPRAAQPTTRTRRSSTSRRPDSRTSTSRSTSPTPPSPAASIRRCSTPRRPRPRHQPQRGARAERRLLDQRLDEEAMVGHLLGRPADRGLDVLDGLLQGRGLERDLLGQRALQRAAGRRRAPSSTRRSGARCTSRCRSIVSNEGGIVIPMFGNYVMARQQDGRPPRAGVPALDARRLPRRRALVVRLSAPAAGPEPLPLPADGTLRLDPAAAARRRSGGVWGLIAQAARARARDPLRDLAPDLRRARAPARRRGAGAARAGRHRGDGGGAAPPARARPAAPGSAT